MQSGKCNTHNWMVIPSPQSNWTGEKKLHPAQFPLELPRRLLARTPGVMVLDPFMGRLQHRRCGIDDGTPVHRH